MTLPSRISFATLGVSDVEAAAAFYERLGWGRSPASVPGEVAFFRLGANVLSLWGAGDLATDAGLPAAAPPPYRGVSLSVNVETEAAVDAALATAAEAGATILKPGFRADWGGYMGYFADPDGNLWEVAYNPGMPLDEHGIPQLP